MEADAGGQIRLRGDFARNQNLTDFTFTPGQKDSVSPYGRWGGTDSRSEIDLYQGYIEWEKILGRIEPCDPDIYLTGSYSTYSSVKRTLWKAIFFRIRVGSLFLMESSR